MQLTMKMKILSLLFGSLLCTMTLILTAVKFTGVSACLTVTNCLIFMFYRVFRAQIVTPVFKPRTLAVIERLMTLSGYVSLAVPALHLALTAKSVNFEILSVLFLLLVGFTLYIHLSIVTERELDDLDR